MCLVHAVCVCDYPQPPVTLVIRKSDHSEAVSIGFCFVKEAPVGWPHCLELFPCPLPPPKCLTHAPRPSPFTLSCGTDTFWPWVPARTWACQALCPRQGRPQSLSSPHWFTPKHLKRCLGTHGPSVLICWSNKWALVTPALDTRTWSAPKGNLIVLMSWEIVLYSCSPTLALPASFCSLQPHRKVCFLSEEGCRAFLCLFFLSGWPRQDFCTAAHTDIPWPCLWVVKNRWGLWLLHLCSRGISGTQWGKVCKLLWMYSVPPLLLYYNHCFSGTSGKLSGSLYIRRVLE